MVYPVEDRIGSPCGGGSLLEAAAGGGKAGTMTTSVTSHGWAGLPDEDADSIRLRARLVRETGCGEADDLHWIGLRPVVGSVLGRVADPLADDDPEAAAMLYGAGDTLAPEFVLAPHVVEARQRAAATLQASLGGTRRGELRAQGMAMDEDDAITYAHAHAAINRRLGQGPP
jgi:hypothetical protein